MTAFYKSDPGAEEEGIDLATLRTTPWRDFSGRRIVADFEGPGLLTGSAPPVVPVADGDTSGGEIVPFADHLSLVLESGVAVKGCVLLGRTEPPTGEVQTVELPLAASGYLARSSRPVARDGRNEGLVAAPGSFLPFFSSLTGVGTAEVMSLGRPRLSEVACVSLASPASMEAVGWRVKSLSDHEQLVSSFSTGVVHQGVVASHMNTAELRVELPPGTRGVRLRKLYDRFHGKQRARVLAEGKLVGTWYVPDEDRTARWAESEFGFALAQPWPGGWLDLAIDPPPGTPLWSVSEMKVFAVTA